MIKGGVRHIFFSIGFALIFFIFLIVAINSTLFLTGGSISWICALIALAGAILSIWYFLRRKHFSKTVVIKVIIGFISVVIMAIGIASYFIDSSYDGNWYHKEAVGLLKNGWNPVYEDSNANTKIYIDAYPKASWIFAANIYQITGNIESGKVYNTLLSVAVFCMAFSYLRTRISRGKTLLLSGVLALSPVAVMQMQTFYVDGALGSLLILLTVSLVALFDKKNTNPVYYFLIIMIIIVAGNLKFTGFVYSGLILAMYWLYALIVRDWRRARSLALSGGVALFFGVLIVGASAYVKNAINHGSAIYPIIGGESVDIMTLNQPVSYGHKTGLHKFFESNMGETLNITHRHEWGLVDSPLKVPFSINLRELETLSAGAPDIRLAGYGVWFGGSLILAVAVAVILLAVSFRRRYSIASVVLYALPIISIAMTVLIIDEAWWARYLPHITLVPVLLTAIFFVVCKKYTTLPYVVIFTLFFNVSLMTALYSSHWFSYTSQVRNDVVPKIVCSESDKPQYGMDSPTAFGFKYNVLDLCPGATFENLVDLPEPKKKGNKLTSPIWSGLVSRVH